MGKREVGKEGGVLKYFPNLQEPSLPKMSTQFSSIHSNLTNDKPKIPSHYKTLQNKSSGQKVFSITKKNLLKYLHENTENIRMPHCCLRFENLNKISTVLDK